MNHGNRKVLLHQNSPADRLPANLMRVGLALVASVAMLTGCGGGGGGGSTSSNGGGGGSTGTGTGTGGQTSQITILHGFTGGLTDGADPTGALVADAAGDLFGTTLHGGSGGNGDNGTVFELKPNGAGGYAESVIYPFNYTGGTDSPYPRGALVLDASGDLFGTDSGDLSGGPSPMTDGAVFELKPGAGGYTETVLYRFAGGASDGAEPYAGLVEDGSGNLFGTTLMQGPNNSGTAFELKPSGAGGYTEAVIHGFLGDSAGDGALPHGVLILDAAGDLFGTTSSGGYNNNGTVFELTPNGTGGYTKTILHAFAGTTTDGSMPYGALVQDASGNLFGTTQFGGSKADGTVFELKPTGSGSYTETLLYNFQGGGDGSIPMAGLLLDASGDLFGTTYEGGGSNNAGTVFELKPNGSGGYTETVLHGFAGGTTDGAVPTGRLIMDASGDLLGTTLYGGPNNLGTAFKLHP